jgi:hypothetical protein
MIEYFKQGFMKRAEQYQVHAQVAEQLFKLATIPQDVSEFTGKMMGKFVSPSSQTPSGAPLGMGAYDPAAGETVPPIAGLGIGALGGGLLGAMNGKKDEKGQTHRLRNALLGALMGGGAGGLLGTGAGMSVNAHPGRYQLGMAKEHVNDATDQAADLFKTFN